MKTPAPNTRVTDILRGMGVMAGLLQRKREDIIVATATDVQWALQVVAMVIVQAERDAEQAFSETPNLTPAESNASHHALLDRIVDAYEARPKA